MEVLALFALFLAYAGDPAPAINEAHYLVKAKNFWDPAYCANDFFVASGKAHAFFYWTFGALTQWFSLEATAWIGRSVGWLMLAVGLRQCCQRVGLPAYGSLVVALLWIVGIQYGNLAGEWVVGGIEAKVPAYGLVMLGISEIIDRKWSRAWMWFGAASAFHVLTGGWAVVASMIAFVITERLGATGEKQARFFSPGLFVGGLLAVAGLWPALQLTFQSSAEESIQAARIYTYVRIRHHLLPSDFPAIWFVRHGLLLAALIYLATNRRWNAGQRRLIAVVYGAIAIAGFGLLVGLTPSLFPDLAAKLLRYYWFRLSDAVVPFGLAILIALQLFQSEADSSRPRSNFALRMICVVALLLFVGSVWQRSRLRIPASASPRALGVRSDAPLEQQQQSFEDWLSVCQWIRVVMPEDEVLLTPRHQQTFKWYTGRAEVVNWKDVPQDATTLLEWNRRFEDVYPKVLGTVVLNSMRVPIGYDKLRSYRKNYGVRFMVVDNRIATRSLPLVRVYPLADQVNETYSVYELPHE